MTNSVLVRRMWELFSKQKWQEAKNLFHSQLEVYWSQTKEKFLGPDNFIGQSLVCGDGPVR